MSTTLEGLRVLDLSRILAGPWCGQCLADLGAEVIKIERPGSGDDTRNWGPPFPDPSAHRQGGDASYFLSANRGKKSVVADLSTAAGQRAVRELTAVSDILIENYRVGGLARYGLDYDSLRPLNPRLIYCSVTGFGQTGSRRHRPGYDFMIQAEAGFMSLTGEPGDPPGGGPLKSGIAISDLFTGMYAVQAVLAAVIERERSGKGQYIDLALFDSTVAVLSMMAVSTLVSGMPPPRMGNAHPHVVPYRLYPTADHPLVVAVGNDAQFERFASVIGRPELARDPRFATNANRVAHREDLDRMVEERTRARPFAHWEEKLDDAGIPFAPVNSIDQVFRHPQVDERGLRVELPHSSGTSAPGPANPIRLSRTPVRHERAAPVLGEHTEEVLCSVLGWSPEEARRFRQETDAPEIRRPRSQDRTNG